jgi:hypothetical protein
MEGSTPMSTTPTPDTLTPEQVADVEQLAAELVKRQDAIAADVERIAEIKTILRDRLPVGTHPAGPWKVLVKKGASRFDAKTFTAAHPFEARPDLYSAQLDTGKVKDRIAPRDLIAFYVTGAPTVVVS